jgi:DNA repair ATPase RecN
MTKVKNESSEIQALREKYTAAIAHHKKLDATLAIVTSKIEEIDQNLAKSIFQIKKMEDKYRLAEKDYLKDEIAKEQLDDIAKEKDASVKSLHDSERKLTVAKQVISEINNDLRSSANQVSVARQRLSNAIRSDLTSQLPTDINDALLQIYATYNDDATWLAMLANAFPAPKLDVINAAKSLFNKELK